MTRRKVLLVALTALALLLVPAQAFAAETVNVNKVSCGGVQASGSGLKASSPLTVTVKDGNSARAIKTANVTTDAKGAFKADVKASLKGVASVEVVAASGGREIIGATQELDAATKKQCGTTGDSALPFTGPARTPILLGFGFALLALGAVMLVRFAYRGRHQVG